MAKVNDFSNCSSRVQELISEAAGLAFPIMNGIANLVPSSARKLSSAEGLKTEGTEGSISQQQVQDK